MMAEDEFFDSDDNDETMIAKMQVEIETGMGTLMERRRTKLLKNRRDRAACSGNEETVQLLLNLDADVHTDVGGRYGDVLAASSKEKVNRIDSSDGREQIRTLHFLVETVLA